MKGIQKMNLFYLHSSIASGGFVMASHMLDINGDIS